MNLKYSGGDAATLSMDGCAAEFEEQRYSVIGNVLPKQAFELFERYVLFHMIGDRYFDFDERTSSFGRYADALGESMLMQLKPIVEQATGKRLVPTYSYLRYYSEGSDLKKHTDRDACEISGTITIGFSGGKIWPIWLEADGADVAVPLDVGDMLIYRGIELPHWRERLDEGYWIQLFVHYIDADGAHVAHRFDSRDSLGPNNTWSVGSGDKVGNQGA